jgi:hypothetical protein
MKVWNLSSVVISKLWNIAFVFTVDAFHIQFMIELHLLDPGLQILDLSTGILTQGFNLILKVSYLLSQRRDSRI